MRRSLSSSHRKAKIVICVLVLRVLFPGSAFEERLLGGGDAEESEGWVDLPDRLNRLGELFRVPVLMSLLLLRRAASLVSSPAPDTRHPPRTAPGFRG